MRGVADKAADFMGRKPLPSIARFGWLSYPKHEKVTTPAMLGSKSHSYHKEVPFSCIRQPADKIIPALGMAMVRREGKAGNRSLIGKDNIFEVFSPGLGIPQVMVVVNKAIEESLLGDTANLFKLNWLSM